MANDTCSACGLKEPTKKTGKRTNKNDQSVGWICCDKCCKWFHTIGVRANNIPIQEISSDWYFCEKCSVLGTLVLKQISPLPTTASHDLTKINGTISELSEELKKLQSELEANRSTAKRQLDKLRNHLQSSDHHRERQAAQSELVSALESKLEVIESGAKLANTCLQSINGHRVAINKIPYRVGENVKHIVKRVLNFLSGNELETLVTDCFRIPVKPSK